MTKIYCDSCGEEIKPDEFAGKIMYVESKMVINNGNIKEEMPQMIQKDLCAKCTDKVKEVTKEVIK